MNQIIGSRYEHARDHCAKEDTDVRQGQIQTQQRERSPLEYALVAVDDVICGLHITVDHLEVRLASVLGQDMTNAAGAAGAGQPQVASSPAVAAADNLRERLEGLGRRLEVITRRLEC